MIHVTNTTQTPDNKKHIRQMVAVSFVESIKMNSQPGTSSNAREVSIVEMKDSKAIQTRVPNQTTVDDIAL
jgi:hypothetical protein